MELGGANEREIGIGIPMSASYGGHMVATPAPPEVNSKLNNNAGSSSVQVGGGAENGSGAAGGGGGSDQEVMLRSGSQEKRIIKYRECLKNHAASIGGHANDGCGEFMPSGEEGTLEALKCAACGCHRNFHRRDTADSSSSCYYCHNVTNGGGAAHVKRSCGLHLASASPPLPLALPSSPMPRSCHPQMIVAFGGEDNDHMGGLGTGSHGMYIPHAMKKRFRTKFTQEQKDKMLAFAEKLGWRIQKHDDLAVQQFCMDVGVKRHVLKVWMHNNKHTLAKKPA